MAFINTSESMSGSTAEEREENLFKKFITHDPTLTELKDNRIKILRPNALYHNNIIRECDFPNLTQLGEYAFQLSSIQKCNLGNIPTLPYYCFYNSEINTLSFGENVLTNIANYACSRSDLYSFNTNNNGVATTIQEYAFYVTYNLTHFFMPNTIMNVLNEHTAFDASRLMRHGYFYVPSDLMNSYKSSTNWAIYADRFRPIEEGTDNDDTITDSWETITGIENPAGRYKIGDTKTILIDGYLPAVMKIVGFDKDVLASDNSKRAKITWMTADYINFRQEKNEAAITEYLSNLKTKINAAIGNKIVEVEKYTYQGVMLRSAESVWIPSSRELNVSIQETDGVIYDDYFTSTESRQFVSAAGDYGAYWPVRTKNTLDGEYLYLPWGDNNFNRAENFAAIIFGFCT